MVCIRGAVTCDINKKDEILSKTKEMLLEIIDRNSLKTDDIVSVIFTATRDIDKAYPAVAARELGITKAALMCFQEMYVKGSLEMCLRCMVSADNNLKQTEAKHVYMGGAKILRPDIN